MGQAFVLEFENDPYGLVQIQCDICLEKKVSLKVFVSTSIYKHDAGVSKNVEIRDKLQLIIFLLNFGNTDSYVIASRNRFSMTPIMRRNTQQNCRNYQFENNWD